MSAVAKLVLLSTHRLWKQCSWQITPVNPLLAVLLTNRFTARK